MPELPEVETMCRGIAPIVGQQIRDLKRGPCKRRPMQIVPALAAIRKRIVGRTVQAIERRGKRVILVLDDTLRFVIEPRMTGMVVLAEPPSEAYVRFQIDFAGEHSLPLLFWDQRGLGTLRLMDLETAALALGPTRLGTDALLISRQELNSKLSSTRRPLKVALLDQKLLAGIGNLYASEILFAANLDPRRSSSSLTREEWGALHQGMRRILRAAIRYEGSTLNDGTYRNAHNEDGGYQNHHRVYQREGERCPRCRDALIRRLVQAQRSTFFCPACQV